MPIPELVEEIRRALPDAGAEVHHGATSQDVVDTALALSLQATSILLLARIAALETALDELTRKSVPMP